jgi:hypothetical protein
MSYMPLERRNNLHGRQERGGGGRYEHNGGSSQQQGGLLGRVRRSSSQRAKITIAQTKIDTGPWSMKGKLAKIAIGKAWAKIFHTEVIPAMKSPYGSLHLDDASLSELQFDVLYDYVFVCHLCW